MRTFWIKLYDWTTRHPRTAQWSAAAVAFALVALAHMWPVLQSGHTVFGDIDFGFWADDYMQRMATPWNEHWSAPTFFNMPRVLLVWPLWWANTLLGGTGQGLFQLVLFAILWLSGMSVFLLIRTLGAQLELRHRSHIGPWAAWLCAVMAGALYLLNPWAMIRVQHLYLLVGYALLPAVWACAIRLTESPTQGITMQRAAWGLAGALLWVVSAAAVHYLLYAGLLLGIWGLWRFGVTWAEFGIVPARRVLLRLGAMGALAVGGSLFFLLPTLAGSLMSSGIAPSNTNSLETLVLFSRHADWHKALLGVSYWWPMFDMKQLPWWFWAGGGIVSGTALLGGLLSLRQSIVRFLLLWCAGTFLLSLGMAGPLRGLLAWLVFDAPGAGAWGFLFRDPNKINGLFLMGIVLLWGICALNAMRFFAYRHHLREKERAALHALWGAHHVGRNAWKAPIWVFWGISLVAAGAWVVPYAQRFMYQKYSPVAVPRAAEQLRSHLQNTPEQRMLSLPRYESELSPEQDVAATRWNNNKATGAIDVLSSPLPTLTATEGVTPEIGHLSAFLTDVLARGLSPHVADWAAAMGAGAVVYHSDIVGFADRDAASQQALRQQVHTAELTQFDFLTLLRGDHAPDPFSATSQMLGTTGGLGQIIGLSHLPGFSPQRTAVVLPGQTHNLAEGDVLMHRFEEDLLLSHVPEAFKTAPAQSTNEADAFTRWGITRGTTPDWRWHLGHLNITNWDWSTDNGSGILFTYSPRRVSVAVHADPMEVGTTLISTQDFADREIDFFRSDDTERIEVQFAPTNAYDALPFIRGEVSRGDTQFWKVVSSEFIDVEELNAYAFGMTISGKSAHQLHGKVKYFSENGDELDVSYVSAPRRVVDFDFVKFSGQFVTPPGTAKIQIQLWTHQRPDEKVFWWVHDLRIVDLAKFVEPNVHTMRVSAHDGGQYQAFARVLQNEHGGRMQLRLSGTAWDVNTKTPGINRFGWVPLGLIKLDRGVHELEIEAIDGFLAVTDIAIVPKRALAHAQQQMTEQLAKTRTLTLLEAESDMRRLGARQSNTTDMQLSNGRGVRLRDGLLVATADILEAGKYTLQLRTDTGPITAETKQITITAHDTDGHLLGTQELDLTADSTRTAYVAAGVWDLPPGRVQWTLAGISTEARKWTTASLHAFDPNEWTEREQYLDTLGDSERNQDCCDCVDLGEDYLRVQHRSESDEVRLSVDAGCSCWWVITASEITSVAPDQEYWLSFDARASFARKNHFKILYLDANQVYIGYEILENTPHADTYDWTHMERIFTPPEHAAFAQFQVWSRENRFTKSQMGLRELDMIAVDDMMLIDALVLSEGTENLFADAQSVEGLWKASGLHEFTGVLEGPHPRITLRGPHSASPLWQMQNQHGDVLQPVPQLGGISGWIVPESTETTTFTLRLRVLPHWRLGWLVSLLSWSCGLVWVGLLWRRNRRSGVRTSRQQTGGYRHRGGAQ